MININESLAGLQKQLDELAQVAAKSQFQQLEEAGKVAAKAQRQQMEEAAKHLAEQTRKQFIEDNASTWVDIGREYKNWRENCFLSKSEVARKIGIAPSTLTKFEEGQPTRLATNIQAGYDTLIELNNLQRKYSIFDGRIADVDQYIRSVVSDIQTLIKEECHESRTAIVVNGLLTLWATVTEALGLPGQKQWQILAEDMLNLGKTNDLIPEGNLESMPH